MRGSTTVGTAETMKGVHPVERHRPGGPGYICAKNLGRRVVVTRGVWIRRPDMDPLTRLAPADEGAGCDPPSPPRGRGQRNAEIERPTNVVTSHGLEARALTFHIFEARERKRRGRGWFRWSWPVLVNSFPSPPWGRGQEESGDRAPYKCSNSSHGLEARATKIVASCEETGE